jgi:hypothetical protein
LISKVRSFLFRTYGTGRRYCIYYATYVLPLKEQAKRYLTYCATTHFAPERGRQRFSLIFILFLWMRLLTARLAN